MSNPTTNTNAPPPFSFAASCVANTDPACRDEQNYYTIDDDDQPQFPIPWLVWKLTPDDTCKRRRQ